ncbi:PASTA domain-containing protein [Thiovibrio sp. JS02]
MAVGKRRAIEKKGKRPVFVGVCLLLALAAFWLIRVTLLDGESGQEQAAEQPEQLSEVISGGRRNIYDRNFTELAVSFRRSSIYVRPLELEKPEEVARQVAQVLDLDAKDVVTALKGERSFAWLGRDVDQKKAEKIADMNLKGVYRIDQVHRYYPENQLGAHVVGFLKDAQGLGGVEFYYDSLLRGGGVYDPRLAAVGVSQRVVEGSDGASLVLTLDLHVQETLEQKLKSLMGSTQALSAMAVLMVPATGEIVASVSLPAFDPNRYWEYSTEERKNRVVEDVVELGGMGRLFHLAAALDKKAGAVPTGTEPGEEEGAMAAAPWRRVQEGIYLSPEGAALHRFAGDGAEYLKFAENIGLASKGEVDLPEAIFALKEGEVAPPGKIGVQAESSAAAAGKVSEMEMGEPPDPGRSATPIQTEKEVGATATPMALLSAFCRLVNGGKTIKPHVLSAIWHDAQVFPVPPREGTGDFTVRPEVSQEMLAWMEKEARQGDDAFAIESLIEKKTLAAPEKSDAGEAGEGVEPNVVMNTLLLAAAPVRNPEMAALIVLEKASLDISANSQARKMAQEMIPLAIAAMAKRPSMPSLKELKVREVGYYRKWEKLAKEAAARPVLQEGQQRQEMPDVRGLSLRKAMQLLQPHGLKVQIAGSGQVASQYPLAGSPLKGVDQCLLELKMVQ